MDFVVAIFLTFLVHLAAGYPTGAPNGACVTMTPGHINITPQTGASQHVITASASTYQAGTPIQVMISSTFKGVLLQARLSDGTTTPIGSFMAPPANTKLMSCTSPSDSVTHSIDIAKTNFSVTWNPPMQAVGNIEFVATIANARETYWLNQKSAVLTPYGLQTSTDSDSGSHSDGGSSSIAETTTTMYACTAILVFSILKKFM